MNNQEKFNTNDLKFIENQISSYKLGYIILPAFLLLMYFFMIWASGEAFISIFSAVFIVILILFFGLALWILQTQQKLIETDLKNGFKEIVEGIIMEKISKKKALYFKINKETYAVSNADYMAFEEGNYVKLEILPLSKTSISIMKIDENS